MEREQILFKLNNIFQDVFDDDDIQVNDLTTAYDIEEWDSLEHINLIAAVEKYFNIEFTIVEVTNIENVGQLVNIIMRKINKI